MSSGWPETLDWSAAITITSRDGSIHLALVKAWMVRSFPRYADLTKIAEVPST